MIKYVIGASLALFFVTGVFTDDLVTKQCLGCLCEASSGCNTANTCSGDVCGPFSIKWAYWADSGKPTVRGESPEAAEAYEHCAGDIYCAAMAVQGYMNKFQQDCNGDGKIDCDDFAAIHKFGGYGCQKPFTDAYGQRYNRCKNIIGFRHVIPYEVLLLYHGIKHKIATQFVRFWRTKQAKETSS